jgi:hypothetical protein
VLLSNYPDIEIHDLIPLHILRKNSLSIWLHDFIAPFHQYLKVRYLSMSIWSDQSVNPSSLKLASQIDISLFNHNRSEAKGTIAFEKNMISEFSFESDNISVWAKRSDIY